MASQNIERQLSQGAMDKYLWEFLAVLGIDRGTGVPTRTDRPTGTVFIDSDAANIYIFNGTAWKLITRADD